MIYICKKKITIMRSVIIKTFVLSLFFVSCKDEKKVDEKSEAKTEKSQPFTVSINAVVEKDDVFQIFYNEDGSENFDPSNTINVNVTGSTQPQELFFPLPEDAMPMALRFDIGANKEQKQVVFKGFKITYLDKSFNVTGAEFFKYFYPNTQIEVDSGNFTAKIKILEDQPYDPILGSTQDLKNEIAKLYQK